jgi:hypothetical protein
MKRLTPTHGSSTFREAYCEKFGCDGNYTERVFSQSLFWHARCLAPAIRIMSPNFFQEDLAAIEDLGSTQDAAIFIAELGYLHGRHQRDRSWLRKTLLLRVSGKRLLRLWIKVFETKAAESIHSAAMK